MAKTEKKEELTLAEVQAQIAQMLAEAAKVVEDAKAEAAKIVEEARGGNPTGLSAEEKAAYDAYMNEEVEVKLFKDNDKYKDPVFVGVNGQTIAIERGVKVKIKRKFAIVLENSDNQDYETSKLIERKSEEFKQTGL